MSTRNTRASKRKESDRSSRLVEREQLMNEPNDSIQREPIFSSPEADRSERIRAISGGRGRGSGASRGSTRSSARANNIGEETDGGESDGDNLPADESSNALASSNTVVAPTSATSGRPTDPIAPERKQARAREELNGANRNAPSIYHDVNGNGLFKIYESNWSFLVKNELNKYDA